MVSRKIYSDSIDGKRYQLEDFLYNLPENFIAQYPLKERDACRLLILNRKSGKIEHRQFSEVVNFLKPGDCLVLNDTRVFPARLLGLKDKSTNQIEIFLLRKLEGDMWETLVKPARKVRIGNKIVFGEELSCDVIDNTLFGGRIVEFNYQGDFNRILEKVGHTPLPPYIKREAEEEDKLYYQTVYAQKIGAVAAPTAGLHFTNALLKKIEDKGITITSLTLHVGMGTFKPVKVDDIRRHKMDPEYYELSAESAGIINKTKAGGGAVVAVGTTTVRALETIADNHGLIRHGRGWTEKFIYPPYKFRMVDGLITNFHLPGSTLLMLVSAFSSVETVKKTYQEAMARKYRFFSYGDAMLIR